MSDKTRKVRPAETYVLGDDELEDLGDTSLTSIMRTINDSLTPVVREEEKGADRSGTEPFGKGYRDPEIDQLLQSNTTSRGSDDSTHEVLGAFDDSEVLMPHEALFSNEDSGNGS